MTLPLSVRDMLLDIGQLAAEVPCLIEGYREFVSIYAAPMEMVMNADCRFPYLSGVPVLFRAIRFRVETGLIAADVDVGNEDLIGLQEIFLPSEDAVEFILGIWKVSVEALRPPRDVAIPI